MKRLFLVICIVLGWGPAFAAIEMTRPTDPFSDLGADEKLTFTERERALHYLNRVAKFGVYTKKPTAYSAGQVLDIARGYEPRFTGLVVSNPLALLNGALFILQIQYRSHMPVAEGGQIYDSPSHVEMRAFILATARVLINAIAMLPDEKQPIELEFRRQRSISDPYLVLNSYLTPEAAADGTRPEPFFGGELEAEFLAQTAKIEKSRTFTSRLLAKVRSGFGATGSAQSCRAAFL